MFKRLLAVVRDALLVPFAPTPLLADGRSGASRRDPRSAGTTRPTPEPASAAEPSTFYAVPFDATQLATSPTRVTADDERARFDALVASINSDELTAMEHSFTRSAVAYAPAPGDVAAIRALLAATRLLGCAHDPERGSLRLLTAYGDIVAATSSEHAPAFASRFVPGECSVMISGYGSNTNLIAAGPGWQFWVEVASLNFDPGASR